MQQPGTTAADELNRIAAFGLVSELYVHVFVYYRVRIYADAFAAVYLAAVYPYDSAVLNLPAEACLLYTSRCV